MWRGFVFNTGCSVYQWLKEDGAGFDNQQPARELCFRSTSLKRSVSLRLLRRKRGMEPCTTPTYSSSVRYHALQMSNIASAPCLIPLTLYVLFFRPVPGNTESPDMAVTAAISLLRLARSAYPWPQLRAEPLSMSRKKRGTLSFAQRRFPQKHHYAYPHAVV